MGQNPKLKATQTRQVLGTGGVVDTRHQGETKRPTEDRALSNLDDWSPQREEKPSTTEGE